MDYFIFNGIDSRVFNIRIQDVTRPDPTINDHYETVPGRPGAYVYPLPYGDREGLTIKFTIKAADEADRTRKRGEVSAWLNTKQRQRLEFPDEPETFYMAKLSKALIPVIEGLLLQYEAEFRADTHRVAKQAKELSQQVTSGTILEVQNDGNEETAPLITIEATAGEIIKPKIIINDKTIYYKDTITAGALIQLDAENFLAYKTMDRDTLTTGAFDTIENSILGKIEGEFGLFSSGRNTVAYTSENDQAAKITITWREKFI